MADYTYRAMDAYGKVHKGRMQGRNERDLQYRLENQGLDLIRCSRLRRGGFRLSRSVERRDLINMLFHLEQLTKSGVPLLEGLGDLRDSVAPGYFRDVMAGLVEEIEGGKKFSAALADFPNVFDGIFVSLIAVGEESGELPRVMHQMGENLRWADELLANTKRIIMYPAIVAAVIFATTAFLMIYLVPQVIPFVEELGGEIPGHTLLLIAVSNLFVDYWAVLLFVPLAAAAFIQIAARTRPEIRYIVDRSLLRLPLFGPISFKIKLSRLANYMALLY